MHWIQKHIMRQLSTHKSQRYTELRPADVDGNLFTYHLQQLQSIGYIQKDDGVYMLSPKGRQFSGRMSLKQGAALLQPKIVVMLVCQNASGDYLLFRWSRQPYNGLVSFPFSKLHFGRTVAETLEEALRYKTNLRGTFSYTGDTYIKTLGESGEVVDHMLAHLYLVTDIKGMLGGHDGLTGTPFWGAPKDVPISEQVPGFTDIFKLVESGACGWLTEIIHTN